MNQYRIAELRREIKQLQYWLFERPGFNLWLRFQIRLRMIKLRHELKQLK